MVTKVSVFLSAASAKRLMWLRDETKVLAVGASKTLPAATFDMTGLLGVICPTIDVQIDGYDSDSGIRGTVRPDWAESEGGEWLERIHAGEEAIPALVKDNSELMTLIGPSGSPTGRAALNPSYRELGVYSVGGFAKKRSPGIGRPRQFFGSIDRSPSGPKREPDGGSDADLAEWATRQVAAWTQVQMSPAERNNIAVAASSFRGDPYYLANAKIDGEWRDIEQIWAILKGGTVFVPLTSFGRNDSWRIAQSVNVQSGFLFDNDEIVVEKSNVLTSTSIAGEDAEYWTVDFDKLQPHTLLGVISRYVLSRGAALAIEGQNLDLGYYNGPSRKHIPSGYRIVLPTLLMTLDAEV